MKALLLTLVLLISLTQSCSSALSPEEENWTRDGYDTEQKWLEPDPLQTMLKRIVRRADQQQFFGLMGRRSSAKSQITRKRQKFQSFVGLMGKRSTDGSF